MNPSSGTVTGLRSALAIYTIVVRIPADQYAETARAIETKSNYFDNVVDSSVFVIEDEDDA